MNEAVFRLRATYLPAFPGFLPVAVSRLARRAFVPITAAGQWGNGSIRAAPLFLDSIRLKTGTKKVRICLGICGLFVFKVTLRVFHSPLTTGDLLSAKIMAGLLAHDSSSRRLPDLSISDINALRHRLQRRVRGGMALLKRHLTSLSSPCGHLDPIMKLRFVLRICGRNHSETWNACQLI